MRGKRSEYIEIPRLGAVIETTRARTVVGYRDILYWRSGSVGGMASGLGLGLAMGIALCEQVHTLSA